MGDSMDVPQGRDQISDNSTNSNIPRQSSAGRKQGNKNRQGSKTRKGDKNVVNQSKGRGNSLSDNTSYSFMSKNLSTKLLTAKYFNSKVLNQPIVSIQDESLSINLSLKIFKDRLDAQAHVWAKRIISMENLSLRQIINSKDETWLNELEKCYIYSYFSAILFALNSNRSAQFPKDRCFIQGHLILHKFIVSRTQNFDYDNFNIVYNFKINEDRYNEIIKIAKSYPFIEEGINEFLNFELSNSKCDSILGRLHDDIGPDGPSIVRYDNQNTGLYLSKENFPIGNSFYSKSGISKEWKYTSVPDQNLLDKTTLFGKACFLCLFDDNDVSNLYDTMIYDDGYYLIKNEVTSICGNVYPNFKSK